LGISSSLRFVNFCFELPPESLPVQVGSLEFRYN
jgi:hypothetical protein